LNSDDLAVGNVRWGYVAIGVVHVVNSKLSFGILHLIVNYY
jgi:hypothetical protein